MPSVESSCPKRETVPVVANGGSGTRPGPYCLSVKEGSTIAHPIWDTCDAAHTLRSLPGPIPPSTQYSPARPFQKDRRHNGQGNRRAPSLERGRVTYSTPFPSHDPRVRWKWIPIGEPAPIAEAAPQISGTPSSETCR